VRIKSSRSKAANQQRSKVFAPPVGTFTNGRSAKTQDLADGVTLSVDIDTGDVAAARRRLEHLLGPVTVAVHSGGDFTDRATGEVQPKTHLHWRLSEPTASAADHAKLQEARWLAAVLVGADTTAAPSSHPLRWPGTWHTKNPDRPRLATNATISPDAEIHLDEALELLQEAVNAVGLGKPVTKAPGGSSETQAPLAWIESAVPFIPNTGELGKPSWDNWIRLGLAFYAATGGSDDGRRLWAQWSAKSPKHTRRRCTRSATPKRWTSSSIGSAPIWPQCLQLSVWKIPGPASRSVPSRLAGLIISPARAIRHPVEIRRHRAVQRRSPMPPTGRPNGQH